MPRQIVYTPKAAKPPAAYSQAVKAAGLVFVSGTSPHDPVNGQIKGTTIQEQTRQCLTNIAAILEEAYLYVDMPAPAFGIQLVYTNPHEPEVATIVREGDVVLMPAGYHPNVAAPGGQINFVWMMAAIREDEDRQYGVVNVQPDFASLGSGLEKARAGAR